MTAEAVWLRWNQEGKSLTGGSAWGGTYYSWDVPARKVQITRHRGLPVGPEWITASADGTVLVSRSSGGDKCAIARWDATTGQKWAEITVYGSVQSVRMSPDGKALAAVGSWEKGEKAAIQLWAVSRER